MIALFRLLFILTTMAAGCAAVAAAEMQANAIFLVASPGLHDPNFRETVVLVTHPRDGPPRSVPVLRDVHFVSDIDTIEGLLQRPEPTRGLRVYAGYAGWAPGQLQAEIERGGWHVLPADAATVFDKNPANIWPELIKRATTKRTLFVQ